MTAFDVYLLCVLGKVQNCFGIITGVSGIIFLVWAVTIPAWMDSLGFDKFPFGKVLMWFVPSWFLCLFLSLTVPDTKTLVAMYGISYVTGIEGAKDIPPELVKFVRKFMADYMEDKK